jgi:hypothetical protein
MVVFPFAAMGEIAEPSFDNIIHLESSNRSAQGNVVYVINRTHFKPPGPVFYFLGNIEDFVRALAV